MSANLFLSLACSVCNAGLGFCVEPNPGGCPIRALCFDCAQTHFLTVEPIDPGPTAEKEA